MRRTTLATIIALALSRAAAADPLDDSGVQIHGFASEGGFVSTANDYIGDSSQGSLAFFEAAVNVSKEVTDKLHVGIQLYGRDVGDFRDQPPRIDWAYLDYKWQPWLGLRGGIIKMPFGLYNEYADVDASRLWILLPQSIYPLRDRSALIAQTGFAVYGSRPLGGAGELDYQAWLGTLDIPSNALELDGASLDKVTTRYVTGAQVFWQPPVDGLKVGATYLRTSIDFALTLDADVLAQLEMMGLLPAGSDGKLDIYQRPDQLVIGSAEYAPDDWLFAAEYSRWLTHTSSTAPLLVPKSDADSERFYAMAARRLSPDLMAGAYYSVLFADAGDRGGHDTMRFAQPFYAWQRDAAATLRWDVNDHWLWKIEGHFIDGAADLDLAENPGPHRYWGLFLLKTTVTF